MLHPYLASDSKWHLIGAIWSQELHEKAVVGFSTYQDAVDALTEYGYSLWRCL